MLPKHCHSLARHHPQSQCFMQSISWRLRSYAVRTGPGLPRALSYTPSCRRDDHQLKDIIPGDLAATLAAHRRSNRQAFRRVTAKDGLKDVQSATAGQTEDVQARTKPLPPEKAAMLEVVEERKEQDINPEKVVRFYVAEGTARSLKSELRALGPSDSRKEDLAAAMNHVKASKTKSKIRRRYGLLHKVDMQKHKAQYKRVVKASGDFREPYQPWEVNTQAAIGLSREALLNEQISKLANWLTLTPDEQAFRSDLALDFTSSLREKLVDIDFWLFGSQTTGLATTMSDIDVGFYLPSMQKMPGERGPSVSLGRRSNRRIINKMLDRINISSIWTKRFDDHEVVWARYPLVRMRHVGSSTDIQIVASQPTRIVSEYIRDSLAEYPQLKPVFILLKASLAARGLDEPHDGGLGSYTLLILIIAVFKRHNVIRRTSVVSALRAVLEIFEKTSPDYHSLRTDVMMTAPPYKFPKRSPNETLSSIHKAELEVDSVAWARHQISALRESQEFLLCLQDPNDPLNDLGKGTYQMLNIQATFYHLNSKLAQWVNGKDIVDDNRQPVELIDWLIGDICNAVQDRRTAFAKWKDSFHGRTELEQMQRRLADLKSSDRLTSGGPDSLAAAPSEQDVTELDLDKAVDVLLGDEFENIAIRSDSR